MDSTATDFHGTLVMGNSYPYFILVALEAGSLIRAVLVWFSTLLACFLDVLGAHDLAIKLLVFVSFVGLKLSDIQRVAIAILPKFYSQYVHSKNYNVFSTYEKKCVVTDTPRVMVGYFCKTFLGADEVLGSEIGVYKGRATGLVRNKKRPIVKQDLLKGMGAPPSRGTEPPILKQRVIFHDGRLVQLPTPFTALLVFLWLPVGFAFALVRVTLGIVLPVWLANMLLFVEVRVTGESPDNPRGVTFVANHKTLMDPFYVGFAAKAEVTGLVYSISRISEMISPIETVRLSRNKELDAQKMRSLLKEGKNLCICPEGTTCREPFLLRFSALFAEVSEEIYPVAIKARQTVFHGTTVTGWKGWDTFFFLMNPFPAYEVHFLPRVEKGDKSAIDVANEVQAMIGKQLGFECTTLTRKDKYLLLNGTDGSVKKT